MSFHDFATNRVCLIRRKVATRQAMPYDYWDDDYLSEVVGVSPSPNPRLPCMNMHLRGHETHANRLSRHWLIPFVLTILLVALMISMTQESRAAVYECRDSAGKSVVTNRKAGLHSCRSIIEGASVPKSPTSEREPQQPSATAVPNEVSNDPEPIAVPPITPNYLDSSQPEPPRGNPQLVPPPFMN